MRVIYQGYKRCMNCDKFIARLTRSTDRRVRYCSRKCSQQARDIWRPRREAA